VPFAYAEADQSAVDRVESAYGPAIAVVASSCPAHKHLLDGVRHAFRSETPVGNGPQH